MNQKSKIFIAGRSGQVGSAIEKKFKMEGYKNIIGLRSNELDLREQNAVREFFEKEKPEYVILAAAKVGGIMANIQSPAEFLYDNLAIQNNIIECSRIYGVKKLLFLASSCIYPRLSPQPMKEEYLLYIPNLMIRFMKALTLSCLASMCAPLEIEAATGIEQLNKLDDFIEQ